MYENDVKLYIFHEIEEERRGGDPCFGLIILYIKTILIHLAYVKTSTANKDNG
jgi:hypothetical protein